VKYAVLRLLPVLFRGTDCCAADRAGSLSGAGVKGAMEAKRAEHVSYDSQYCNALNFTDKNVPQ
jgi:hypothetical protein